MTQRRGLGRGLGALIPSGGVRAVAEAAPGEAPAGDGEGTDASPREYESVVDLRDPENTPTAASITSQEDPASLGAAGTDDVQLQFRELPVDRIRPNPRQPRQVFDEEGMAELVHSITTIGLLQPIVVRPQGSDFELVAGERRLRAAKLAGLAVIPALIRHTADDVMLRDALLENLHRVQLNPLEEAAAYSQLLADFSCTQEELARRVGRSRPQVANTMRLLNLPPSVQRRVAAGVLSAGHARAILGAPDAAAMERLADRVVAEGLSVRAVEELVILGPENPTRRRGRSTPKEQPVEYATAAERLGERLETRVRIDSGKRRDRIVIEFAGTDDLARLVETIEGTPGS